MQIEFMILSRVDSIHDSAYIRYVKQKILEAYEFWVPVHSCMICSQRVSLPTTSSMETSESLAMLHLMGDRCLGAIVYESGIKGFVCSSCMYKVPRKYWEGQTRLVVDISRKIMGEHMKKCVSNDPTVTLIPTFKLK